jgi:hypothetical protein
MSTAELAARAAAAVQQSEKAGIAYAKLCAQEMDLEAGRAAVKRDALRRIMAGDNDLTKRPHSASSAEDIVSTDPVYREYLKTMSETVLEKNIAFAHAQASRLMAELAIAQLHIEAAPRREAAGV